jgi:hypothetical protein
MTYSCDWIPGLLLLQEYSGDWIKYIEAVYNHFKADFIVSSPKFQNKRVGIMRDPLYQQKEFTFWHCTSEGDKEDERLPDIRRCERIRWPRPIIEHSNDKLVRCWRNKRRSEKRILLWFYEDDYLVVLTERKQYVLLWTAYLVTYEHTKTKLLKEFEEFQKG